MTSFILAISLVLSDGTSAVIYDDDTYYSYDECRSQADATLKQWGNKLDREVSCADLGFCFPDNQKRTLKFVDARCKEGN